MLFHSFPFLLVFLPLVVAGYVSLARHAPSAVRIFLIGASVAFYAWWNPAFLPLLLASMAFNLGIGTALQSMFERGATPLRRRLLLGTGVAANLLALGYFKYRNFFLESLSAVGWSDLAPEALVLPLGISFVTFEQITYLADAHAGRIAHLGRSSYFLFISFFPHLIAGPIVRYGDLAPQFVGPTAFRLSAANFTSGLMVVAIGLFKKVVLADTFAGYADPVFDRMPAPSFFDAWGGSVAFGLQVYFDFSAYSDMAVGLAQLFGVRLPENFDSPFKSTSLVDFWRRWHMTLSGFLRDYVYIPLGGNRGGQLAQCRNLFLTIVLGGAWHGAGWTYLSWGAFHAAGIVVNHLWRSSGRRLPAPAGWLLTFAFVLLGWPLFRSATLEGAWDLLCGMFGANGFGWDSLEHSIGRREWKRMGFGLFLVLLCPNRQQLMARDWNPRLYVLAFVLLAGGSLLMLGEPAPFIYFQF